jgi:hypothetical protein
MSVFFRIIAQERKKRMLKLKAKIRHNRRLFTQFFLLVLAGAGVLLAGCDSPFPTPAHSDNEFTTMEVKNKIAHFSFEYRNYYHVGDAPYIMDDKYFRFTAMSISAPTTTMPEPIPEPGKAGEMVEMSYTPASIGFLVSNSLNRPYVFAADRIENSVKSLVKWPHFIILERKTITISGIPAEMMSYKIDGVFYGPKLLYQTDIAFDYAEKKWDIDLSADIALTDMVKEDLQHVIDTFKILE